MKNIVIIQYLRVIATVIVVLTHSASRLMRTFPEEYVHSIFFYCPKLAAWGHISLDLFFVISGCMMVWSSSTRFGQDGSSSFFLKNRIIRILPIYWIYTSLGVVAIAIMPQILSFDQTLNWNWIISSYLFFPYPNPYDYTPSPVLGLGWTLNYEIYFYLCFSLALKLKKKNSMIVLCSIFMLSVVLGMLFHPTNFYFKFYTHWIIMDFSLGIIAGYIVTEQRRLSQNFAKILISLGIFFIFVNMFISIEIWGRDTIGIIGFMFRGIPCFFLVIGCLSLWKNIVIDEKFASIHRLFLILGEASYSIYLFQIFSLLLIAMLFKYFQCQRFLHIDMLIVLLTVSAICLGLMMYFLLEKPIISFLKSIVIKKTEIKSVCYPEQNL